jgi:hypothetical protein
MQARLITFYQVGNSQVCSPIAGNTLQVADSGLQETHFFVWANRIMAAGTILHCLWVNRQATAIAV